MIHYYLNHMLCEHIHHNLFLLIDVTDAVCHFASVPFRLQPPHIFLFNVNAKVRQRWNKCEKTVYLTLECISLAYLHAENNAVDFESFSSPLFFLFVRAPFVFIMCIYFANNS